MKNLTFLTFILFFIFLFSCEEKPELTADKKLEIQANEIAHKYIITDGHVDLPYRLDVRNFKLTKEFIGIPIETDKGDFDYVRAKKGGLDAPFMSIYIPASFQENGGAKMFADSLIDMVQKIIEAHPDNFTKGDSPADCEKAFAEGKIALPMGMENGAPIMDDLANVQHFYDRGVRYITLTHSKVNQICDSSYDTIRTWNGLSPFGIEVVEEMNKVGIMVDISHVSDSTFYQVMELAKAPCIASHSSCRKFVPGFERNMDDDMIKLLGKNNGVICINFGSTFLDGKLRKKQDEDREKLSGILTEKGLEASDSLAEPIIEQFKKDNPRLFSDVEMVANHIDHVVKLAGIDHVGLGSDFDGVGDSLPVGLKDVSQFPNLVKVLLQRGYSEEDIAKICYQNVFRVWSEVEKVAASM
ncbi:MAG: membrane dipeptidase [Granulosicoccus sp.]|jgi:membrane dipeptidase